MTMTFKTTDTAFLKIVFKHEEDGFNEEIAGIVANTLACWEDSNSVSGLSDSLYLKSFSREGCIINSLIGEGFEIASWQALDLSGKEFIPLVSVNTYFGPIYIDEPYSFSHREDESKVKLYDSNGKYLDYIEYETICYEAGDTGDDDQLVGWMEEFLTKIQSIEEVVPLLCEICGWDEYFSDWKQTANHLALSTGHLYTEDEVLEDDYVNVLSNGKETIYIVIPEC